jgi:hypothetical protein
MPLNAEYPMIRWLERNGYDVRRALSLPRPMGPLPSCCVVVIRWRLARCSATDSCSPRDTTGRDARTQVSYWSCVDADRYASRLATTATHSVYLSVGHDEYWSGEQRRGVTAARDRGMHLAFLSGNEVYWRTRWEGAADGTPHRTLVVYKETQHVAKLDPLPHEWTGTWRDGRAINPLGAQPENALTGQVHIQQTSIHMSHTSAHRDVYEVLTNASRA